MKQYLLKPDLFLQSLDGTDAYNKPVSSGVYFYRLTTESGISLIKNMILLKIIDKNNTTFLKICTIFSKNYILY